MGDKGEGLLKPEAAGGRTPSPGPSSPQSGTSEQLVPTSGTPSPSVTPRKRSPDDFEFLRTLGEGSYATVKLAREKETGREFAIKVLNKAHIVKEKKVKYVNIEKKVFARLGSNPYFVRLCFTFQDPGRLYYVLSYASNGELLHYIRKLGSFDEDCARFYTAETVAALEHMHRLNIIHRDLKPENILLSSEMHIKITDFGTARITDDPEEQQNTQPGGRSSSFVGTAEYVSPEILRGKEVTKSADLWALGCVIYQMIASRPCFRGPNEYQIFQKVTTADYEVPSGFPAQPKDLIGKLIVLNPAERLGADTAGGYTALKAHPWLIDINWETLHTQKPPELRPYLPPTADSEALSSDINAGGDGGHTGPTHIPDDESEGKEEKGNAPQSEDREELLKKQQETNKWSPFVPDDELIVYESLVFKRRGFWGKDRQLILTDGPRLIYLDPESLRVKGKIPFDDMRPELKNSTTFFIHTPQRTFYLEDRTGKAAVWVGHIEAMCNRHAELAKLG
eukprot:comp20176_c0_seq1/m.25010 comp20176_c0_seq1/g.25010  ORF comp20176_c0_seq1/g.25010 comp20176_c0_seq1/m.25010 type:complete len:508 (-) comp20176_c0_seq1:466-1989(-)